MKQENATYFPRFKPVETQYIKWSQEEERFEITYTDIAFMLLLSNEAEQ
jgi:hypothetical protein